ncbi:MAG: type II toxin-antitoxin system VapC family toxin [Spirochaetota bacterium]
MRYVIDASVALRWYLEEEKHENADAIHLRAFERPELFAVPELFAYETFSGLFRLHPRPLETFQQGIIPLLHSGLLRYPMTDAIAGKAARFIGFGLTGYDAVYVALAEELGALWLTFDREAHSRIEKERISVDLGAGLPAEWENEESRVQREEA